MDDLLYVVNHIFMPLKLPQEDDRSPRNEQALAQVVTTPTVSYCDRMVTEHGAMPQFSPLPIVADLLTGLARLYDGRDDYDVGAVSDRLAGMKIGDVSAFLIREQNAGIIFRVQSENVICEAFEVSATNSAVMACERRLVRTFPGTSTSIPRDVFENPYFRQQLSIFISDTNREVLEGSAAHTRKAGTDNIEIRESAHPQYITDLLMLILLATGGKSNVFVSPARTIQKRVADDVLWDHAYAPWRRSQLWLVIRVALQTTLPELEYKCLILYLLASIARLVLSAPAVFDNSILDCIRKKIGRRAAKLCALDSNAFVLQEARQVCESITAELCSRWKIAQEESKPSYSLAWKPKTLHTLDIEGDTYLDLAMSSQTIQAALRDTNSRARQSTSFIPPPLIRLHPLSLNDVIQKHLLRNLVVRDDPDNHKELSYALLDLEGMVVDELTRWTSQGHAEGLLPDLVKTMQEYFTIAERLYSGNAEAQSTMIMTILDLWMAIDKIATRCIPLLSSYPPDITPTFLEPLLVRSQSELKRVRTLATYLNGRSHVATQPSVFAPLSSKSFSVLYFDTSLSMQKQKVLIERQAQAKKTKKTDELRRLNAMHEACKRTLHDASCNGTPSKCKKCLTEKHMQCRISVEEWPLPANQYQAKFAIFEMYAPMTFVQWREATYSVLFDMFTLPESSHSARPLVYEKLAPYMGASVGFSRSSNRITLGSTKKSWKRSHYRRKKLPTTVNAICVPNALEWHLYDTKSEYLIHPRLFTPTTNARCTLRLPEEPTYSGLQWALDGVDHEENAVVARQTERPRDLSPHEFVAFGCLRAGAHVQWMNIARAIAARTLSFRSPSVHALISQTVQQVGPFGESGHPLWHEDLASRSFCVTILSSARSLLNSCRGNWQEIATVQSIVAISTRMLAETRIDPFVASQTTKLLRQCREVTYTWATDLVNSLPDLPDVHVSARKETIRQVAATCCLTMDVDGVVDNVDDWNILVNCLIILHDNREAREDTSNSPSLVTLGRVRRFAYRRHQDLCRAIERTPRILDRAVLRIWPTYRPGTCWSLVSGHDHWLHAETSIRNGSHKQKLHFNTLNGAFLVGGKSIGNLPIEITEHPSYRRLFNQTVLRVVPADIPNFDYQSIDLVFGNELFFTLQDGKLLIQAVNPKTGEIFRYIPHNTFSGDLPTHLVRDFAHWLDLSTFRIDFRSISTPWIMTPHSWQLNFNFRRAERSDKDGYRYILISAKSKTFKMVSERLGVMDDPSHHIVTIQENVIDIYLHRLQLAFQVDLSAEYPLLQSKTYPGFAVDEDQSLGTLIGLHSKLILRDTSPSRPSLPRRVLVPYGELSYTLSRFHTNVLITTDTDHPSLSHTQLIVNQDLGVLVGDGTLQCHFFRILLHALTAQPLCDPLTGRTGTTEALNELASAFSSSFQTLGLPERALLQEIRALTPQRVFYPDHLKTMQTIRWSKKLPSFAQRATYEVLVGEILDYHATLRHVFHHGEDDADKEPQYHVGLLARATSRESTFPLTDSIAGSSSAPDKVYKSRQLDQLHSVSHYSVGLMITSLNPVREQPTIPPPTGHLYRLFEEIKTEYLSVPFPDLSVESYPPTSISTTWLSPWNEEKDLAEFWFGFYQWCHSAQPSPEARYLLLFSLCSQAYTVESPTSLFAHLLPYMIAIFKCASELPPLPSWTSYTLQFGRIPSQATVSALIAKAARPRDTTPSGALTQTPSESRAEYDARRDSHYRAAIHEGSKLLLKEIMAQWPLSHSETVAVAVVVNRRVHRYFDVRAITLEAAKLFVSCRRNCDLYGVLNMVEDMIILPGNHVPLSSIPKPSTAVLPAPKKRRDCTVEPSLRLLLNTTSSSLHLWPPRTPLHLTTNLISGGVINADEANQLHDVLDTLAASSARLRRVYAAGISQSAESLQSKVEHAPSNAPPLTLLRQHHSDWHDACDVFISHIQGILRPTTLGEATLAVSGLWPAIDSRSILLQLSKGNWSQIPSQWKNTISRFAATFMYAQQLTRMVQYTVSGQMTELNRELKNCDSVDSERAKRHPDWFLIQIENNFRALPLQLDVADEMFSPQDGRNITLQLNMGEGKTAVIVPMVASSLADGDHLVRVVVLKPLAPQMFQLLRERVSLFCNRRIFYLPFSRQLKLDASRLSLLHDLYETCRRTGGILVTQPEHALSVRLLAVEKMITQDYTNDNERVNAVHLHQLLAKNARDILDESDELLHARYQLVYTMGAQQDLECSPNRWLVMQDVLSLAAKHVEEFTQVYGVNSGIEVRRPNVWAFPLVKLPESFGDELIGKVVEDILEGQQVRGLNMLFIPPEHAQIIQHFITHRIPRDSILSAVQQLFQPDPMLYNILLLLRGLFVERLLVHVLCRPRWRVDYGLVEETRSLLAVPYRAKDVPSPHSEFGHPDIAILLTCLAYYYSGLDKDQVRACLKRLLLDSNPVMLYESWIVDIPLDILPISLRHVAGINFNDTAQFVFLYDIFRYCRAVIDFYLARAVFPRAMKEFPDKLSSSGWDLAERRVHPTTGFSGTNDNQHLLPTSITQVDPVDQSSTNALVLTYLLRPENAEYTCTRDAASGRTMSGQQLVSLLAARREVRAFLDVGAQMLDLGNHDVATQWLAEREDIDAVQAAIYFNDNDELMVVRRNGDLEILQSSVYRDRLGSCLVYLDDAHTRGTDLKMPREWRAAVTIGKKVTKDRLVQGCMRMRQLGKGQSLSFLAPPDVDTLIRNSRPSPSDSAISVADIVRWTMVNTCVDIAHHAPQWAQQGTDFYARSSCLQSVSALPTSVQQRKLRSVWLQRESRTLTELYGVKTSAVPVDAHLELVKRLQELGLQAVYSCNVDEEQEREISHEVEAEQQREYLGAPQIAQHHFDPKLRTFAMSGLAVDLDSFAISPLVVVKPILDRHLSGKDPFSQKFRVTRDFAHTILGSDNGTQFLKDVQWLLRDKRGNVVVVSQFEANKLVPILRGQPRPQVFLHVYSPRVTGDGHRFDRFAFHCVPTASETTYTYSALSQLNLFAGQLYPSTYEEYIRLCNWLGISTTMGSRAQPDGFVLLKNRDNSPGMQMYCAFLQSPVGFVRELLNVRRKRQDFSLTPLGKMLHAQVVRPVDVERAQ